MKTVFITPQQGRNADDLRHELNALWEALNSCDEGTYQSVISLLREAGSLPE